MEWEGQPKDVSSALITKRTSKFIKELESNELHQQNQMNQSGRWGELDGSQQKVNPGDETNEMVSSSFDTPEIPLQPANQNHLDRNAS